MNPSPSLRGKVDFACVCVCSLSLLTRSLAPKRNRLLMFQVSERSFHQVAEVLSHDKRRLSLHGWFHGEPLESSPQVYQLLARSPLHADVAE